MTPREGYPDVGYFLSVTPDKFSAAGAEWHYTTIQPYRGVPPYTREPLYTALTSRYKTDAHFVTYIIIDPATSEPLKHHHRLNKEHLEPMREHGFRVFHTCVAADVDMPGHRDIFPSDVRDVTTKLRPLGYSWYTTQHGLRVIAPLLHLVTPETYEANLMGFFQGLQNILGVSYVVDTKCMDWTRHFRLPLVVRDGKPTYPANDVTGPWGRIPRFTEFTPIKFNTYKPRHKPSTAPLLPPLKADRFILKQAIEYITHQPQAVAGSGGHNLTLSIALALTRGFSLDTDLAYKILERWNYRNTPPWKPKELQKFLMNGSKRLDIPFGYLIKVPENDPMVEDINVPSSGTEGST